MSKKYYSENWYEATDKFVKAASKFGGVKWAESKDTEFKIPYIFIGTGPNKVVINSGVHGIEGYFGSAAQLMFLNEIAPHLSKKVLKQYTIVLIHVVNGWGMENRMREVKGPNGELVDLNRNFGVDFSKPDALPKNEKYKYIHDILLSVPHIKKGQPNKMQKLLKFREQHLEDGVWASAMRGQYAEPYGLTYGGNADMPENKMAMQIYDNVMKDGTSLISIGLHTGVGRFYKKLGYVSTALLVSHPDEHKNTVKFREMFDGVTGVEGGISLLGDLVDCLEIRYADKGPIYTADYEIGTGESPVRSQVLKRMDMGDARYDLLNYGKINPRTRRNLTESWYPSHPAWRQSALDNARLFLQSLVDCLEN